VVHERETLKQIAPAVRSVALLFNPHTAPYANFFIRVAEAAAPSFGVEPIAAGVHDDGELERAVADRQVGSESTQEAKVEAVTLASTQIW
jgi:hypothetical protein